MITTIRAAALATFTAALPAMAGVPAISGLWTAHPQGHAITGCDASLTPVLEAMALTMAANAGAIEIAWEDGRFDVDSFRRAQPDNGQAATWYQPAPDLIVAVPHHRGYALPDGPIRISMHLVAPDTIETKIVLDATTLRILEEQPVAEGTEGCRMVIDSMFMLDV
ncbi:hypothetical protein [Jannaschia aquimarina]|uniref:Uncharacterized protein n=1 Tax=Jannaschia aquimarina TaxID=935700 RepID=A0A0D1EN76_9RHOB|nr:hypothetical protein [Jannaschia aquimarina]KIT17150.1 hypothetical protein jaqu_11130 [Jannaschia aquimarina]SNT29813.1 hypothetical protein SAMN05421775_110101 [Jannaschia aquimarina]